MKREEQQYFTFADVVNVALSKIGKAPKSESEQDKEKDMSLNVFSDLTYNNVWNAFTKWCQDVTDLNQLIEIHQFGDMFFFSGKPLDGIAIKLSKPFLQDHQLIWDEDLSTYERNYQNKFEEKLPQAQKLNYNAIAKELNTKTVLVQNALSNLFNAIGEILSSNQNCLIDLGLLGSFYANDKKVCQYPCRTKGDGANYKKTTIKSLIDRRNKNQNTEEDEKINLTSQGNEPQITGKGNVYKVVPKNINFKMKPKAKLNFNFKNLKQGAEVHPKEDSKGEVKIFTIPMPNPNWKMKDMLNATFKRLYIQKAKANPVLFNEYSNTKAAPFTTEKTQIPLTHRVGSFYTLSLQDFIIDKTTKSIKRLCDDYFYKYKDLQFEQPATEMEEYLYLINPELVDEKKIEMKRRAYERYKTFIRDTISDNFISEMNPNWLTEITRKSQAFGFKSNPQGDEVVNNFGEECIPLLNECVNEMQNDYCESMKRAILDYILKHPEQKEKLNIPIEFKRIKEYAEEKVTRPSDGDVNWKSHWNRNKLAISNNLYIMCENITKIMKYFVKNLRGTYYIKLDEEDSWPTKKLANFVENQKKELEEQKGRVNSKWKDYVGGLLRKNKVYKDQLILYFKSVSGLMSSELRELIIESIRKYYTYIQLFKKDSYLSAEEVLKDQFNPESSFERSFIEIDVKEDPNGEKFIFSEELSEIHSQLKDIVNKITKCSVRVERPDNIFIKNMEKHEHLWEVPIIDNVVTDMSIGIEQVIEENINVIAKVTDLYEPYVFVMKEKENIRAFLDRKDAKVTRDEVKKKIEEYENKIKQVNEMPNVLYMNMIKVNCKEINDTIRSKLDEFINDLLKYIRQKILIDDGKRLIEEVSNMFQKCEITIQTEKDVHDSEEQLEKFSQENKKQYTETYEDILEWFFFYLSYDTYDVFHLTNENSNGFDATIKSLHDQLNKIEKTLKDFGDRINSEKNRLLKSLDDAKARYVEKVKNYKIDLEGFKGDLKNKKKLLKDKEKGSQYTRFFEELQEYQRQGKALEREYNDLGEKELLLTNNQFEDETIKNCLDLLEPIINYFCFDEDYKTKLRAIRDSHLFELSLNEFSDLIKRDNVYEKESSKLPSSYKDAQTDRNNYEKYFKTPYNVFKLIYPLIEIHKNTENVDEENEDEADIIYDNALYCHEVAQFLHYSVRKKTEVENQEMLVSQYFGNLASDAKDLLEKVDEVQPIIDEWQTIYQMHLDKKKIKNDFSKQFVIEKLPNKEFYVITKQSFEDVIDTMKKIVTLGTEKLALFKEGKNNIKAVESIKKYKEIAEDVLVFINKIKERQTTIEELFENPSLLKKKDKQQVGQLFRSAQNTYTKFRKELEAGNREIHILYENKKDFEKEMEEIGKCLKEIQN